MDSKEKCEIVEECGDTGCKQDCGVTHTHEFGHYESDSAHDRWSELSSSGCNCFDSCCELLSVPGLLHHGNRNGSCRRNIRDRRTVDHSQERTGQNCDLCRSTCTSSNQGECNVVDELTESTIFQI